MAAPTALLVSLFHPELVRGGSQQVCYELFRGLRDSGQFRPILLASTQPDENPALFKSGAQITGFDEREDEFLFLSDGYDYWWHRLTEPALIKTFAEFLRDMRPDIVHFHHFLTYGVELLSLTRRVLPNARIVFTFHEFTAICNANGHMVRRVDGSLCRGASQVRCHQCFPERTPEDFFLRKMWLQRHLSVVDVFTCPSAFMIEQYAGWGIDRARLVHVPNGQPDYAAPQLGVAAPVRTGGQRIQERRSRFGFFGQLVDSKGVQILLRAVAILRAQNFTDFVVEINGANIKYASPEIKEEIETFLAEEEKLPIKDRVIYAMGSYHIDNLASRMARVDWVIVPSIWWETFCLVISEAWMFGKPVICSNIGAMAERVEDQVNGLHFEVGDPRALAEAMRRAATEEGLWDRLASALPPAPAREQMVGAFEALYAGARPIAAGAAPDNPDHRRKPRRAALPA